MAHTINVMDEGGHWENGHRTARGAGEQEAKKTSTASAPPTRATRENHNNRSPPGQIVWPDDGFQRYLTDFWCRGSGGGIFLLLSLFCAALFPKQWCRKYVPRVFRTRRTVCSFQLAVIVASSGWVWFWACRSGQEVWCNFITLCLGMRGKGECLVGAFLHLSTTDPVCVCVCVSFYFLFCYLLFTLSTPVHPRVRLALTVLRLQICWCIAFPQLMNHGSLNSAHIMVRIKWCHQHRTTKGSCYPCLVRPQEKKAVGSRLADVWQEAMCGLI